MRSVFSFADFLSSGGLTVENHAGVEMHGFLSHLVKCNLEGKNYRIYGCKGKQVRDNMHADDVASFIETFIQTPRKAAVYNIGGGRENTCSILEAFDIVYHLTGKKMQYEYVDQPRAGDHICYYSDLTKLKSDYPSWNLTVSLSEIFGSIVDGWMSRRQKT